MRYIELDFTITPYTEDASDVLSVMLADVGFDTFQSTDNGVKAYVPESDYLESSVVDVIGNFFMEDVSISYSVAEIEDKNWNEEWERNGFEPIVVDGLCTIHSTDHTGLPRLKYDITINPCMAFGSGTHDTTYQLTSLLLQEELAGKCVLDMGCGTCVLAIAMCLKGAEHAIAIDIDKSSVENSGLNCSLNEMENIEVLHGDATLLESYEGYFDLIVANIHRNIIINDMPDYVRSLTSTGKLWVSGFYSEDVPTVKDVAENLGLKLTRQQAQNDWAVLCFERTSNDIK